MYGKDLSVVVAWIPYDRDSDVLVRNLEHCVRSIRCVSNQLGYKHAFYPIAFVFVDHMWGEMHRTDEFELAVNAHNRLILLRGTQSLSLTRGC